MDDVEHFYIGIPSGLSSVNLWVEWERILRLIKADVPAHSSAT
jgi:hypothetical protein